VSTSHLPTVSPLKNGDKQKHETTRKMICSSGTQTNKLADSIWRFIYPFNADHYEEKLQIQSLGAFWWWLCPKYNPTWCTSNTVQICVFRYRRN